MSLAALNTELHQVLADAQLIATRLPGLEALQLWLLDPANLNRAFSSEETRRLLDQPPYWSFCWGSGLALARWVLAHPERVRGKRVLDFGSGSGVVAIACAMAGAQQSIACDIDAPALLASNLNAQLNGVDLVMANDYFAVTGDIDLIMAADVLYDSSNRVFLEHFRQRAAAVILADSRVRDLQHPGYRRLDTLQGQTWPDLGEPLAFREVALYGNAN
ncbi:MAG: protein methyltransferase [Gammaproteobacteria bacterium HGW-Gammaproteobacteria-11]|nr:MAG: protein methyltransferase [Gammaproteobacteria bacterium HGW-Gammaproteobacteria-11]